MAFLDKPRFGAGATVFGVGAAGAIAVYIARLTASNANAVPLWLLWLCLGVTIVGVLIAFAPSPQSAEQANGHVERLRLPRFPTVGDARRAMQQGSDPSQGPRRTSSTLSKDN